MDSSAGEEETIESEFAKTLRYIDLYVQQKTDLFLQHYVFEPVNFLLRQIMYLAVIVTLLAAGTIVLVIGVVLFISKFVPLWAALLITGAVIFVLGVIIACMVLSNTIVLGTPVADELIKNEKP